MRVRFLYIFLALFVFFQISTSTVFAANPECDKLTARVDGATIYFKAEGCSAPGDTEEFYIHIYQVADDRVPSDTAILTVTLRKGGRFQDYKSSVVIARPGAYSGLLYGEATDYKLDSAGIPRIEETWGPTLIKEVEFTIVEPEEDESDLSALIGEPINADIVLCSPGRSCVKSALGEIPFDNTIKIASTIANIGVGIGGAIAIILIAFASFKIMTSAGDPRRLQGAKEMLAGAIFGILMVIFSGLILRFLGVEILGIF